MENNEYRNELTESDSNDFEQRESVNNLSISDFEQEFASLRKKDRKRMLFIGFLAGLMIAFGASMYIARADIDNSYAYQDEQFGGDYNGSYTSTGGLSAGGAGGCCGGGGASLGDVSLADLEKQALEQYKQEVGSASDVKAKASDYGCHIQIDIADKTGKTVRSYGYQGGQLYVIS